MKDLSKKVIKTFLWSLLIIYSQNIIVDEIFDYFFNQIPPRNTQSFWTLALIYFASKIFVLIRECASFIKKIRKYFQEEMKRQMDQQSLLYASIAHDLKTPLTSVKGYSKALLDGKIKAEDLEKTYQTIYRKTDQMNGLLVDLFEYSKLSNEGYQPEKVPAKVSELAQASVIGHYPLIEEKGIHLEVMIEEGLTAEIVPIEMSRVFDNLILNAIVHNDPGIRMAIGLKKGPQSWTFFVADSGLTIPEKEQDRLFAPFSKMDTSRPSQGGSGLGLAIVQKIVLYHKGTVKISHNFPGYTKAFVVEIPN